MTIKQYSDYLVFFKLVPDFFIGNNDKETTFKYLNEEIMSLNKPKNNSAKDNTHWMRSAAWIYRECFSKRELFDHNDVSVFKRISLSLVKNSERFSQKLVGIMFSEMKVDKWLGRPDRVVGYINNIFELSGKTIAMIILRKSVLSQRVDILESVSSISKGDLQIFLSNKETWSSRYNTPLFNFDGSTFSGTLSSNCSLQEQKLSKIWGISVYQAHTIFENVAFWWFEPFVENSVVKTMLELKVKDLWYLK